jgi:hypothetical protein
MKIGIDTIFYIIIAIIILATTLNRKRKKVLSKVPLQDSPSDENLQPERMEKPFSPADFFREAMMQVTNIEEQQVFKTEEQSLEQIIDEEEMIPDEEATIISEQKERAKVTVPGTEPDVTILIPEEPDDKRLFKNPEDIRKAIIFSEVLNRPDY